MASRIAVLELRARSDTFLGDPGLWRLADRLERSGHSVSRLEALMPAGESERARFLAALEDDVAGSGLDALVVSRAWDAALLETLRRGLRGGKLVRLTSGTAAALDDRFDAVVDERGLTALLRGEDVPAPSRPPSSAREIRALRVLSARDPRDVALPERAGSLPAIRGPATGCPYLVDAAKQPAFAHLALDRSEVQTRGCTFCLDNTGAYAAVSAEETVAQWLAQLEVLRGSGSSGRLEVLLIDERPHPHLPRLFGELARRPGLAPIELLIKSRVDWLLEHRGALEEACALAGESGSILHVYLVGFESFDDETLALFNKGTTAADNVSAIALLRELAERHPHSFEHKRLRAHGFVAFTPWTTPEALLRNAAMMRETRFAELRSEAARTRLRLYPRTPLHALAKADGLLVEDFSGARGDRAAEQGYDASFAWRFSDPRLEAIFAACAGLHAYAHDLSDADLLEHSTRFVLRWPGLVGAPDAAHLPLIEAVRSWNMPARDVTTTLGAAAILDLEVERIAAGSKRASLKENVPLRDAADLARAYRAMGLHAEIVEQHEVDSTGGAHTAGGSLAIVAVGGTEADVALAVAAQRSRDVRAMGALMGYPSCCTEAFLAQPDRRDNVENERATLRRTADAPVDPLLVRIGHVRLVSHHPCRADCEGSKAIARTAIELVDRLSPPHAARLRAALDKTALFLDHSRAALLSGAFTDAKRFAVSEIEPVRWSELGARVDDVVEIELASDHVVLIGRGGERRRLAADRPLIVIPGEPLPAISRAHLAPRERPKGSPRDAQIGAARTAERRQGAATRDTPQHLEEPQRSLRAAGPPRGSVHLLANPTELPLRWLELTPDYRCNQRCLGCGVMNEGGPSQSASELARAIHEGRRAGITQLWIGGGEPTTRRDLLPLVREARARGYERVRLQTNAAMLAYPDVVRRLVEAGVTEIAASIKGPDAPTHDRMTRTAGSFDLLCRGIENARAAGLRVEGDVLAYRSTSALLPEIVRVFFARGVERFRVWMMFPDASDPEALAEEPRIGEVARAVSEAIALGLSEDPDFILSLHTPPCALPDERGRFFAPELGLIVHDAGGARFRLERSEIEGGHYPPACAGCGLRARCSGVRAAYVARHGAAELRPARARG